MPRKKTKGPDAVVRFEQKHHKRLKSLVANESELLKLKRPMTMNEAMDRFLTLLETVRNSPVLYAVELYEDPALARGEAIMRAVKNKTTPRMPVIVAVIGEDGLT